MQKPLVWLRQASRLLQSQLIFNVRWLSGLVVEIGVALALRIDDIPCFLFFLGLRYAIQIMFLRLSLALSFLVLAVASNATSLTDHGVSLVSDGVIDHVSGLHWLDADLTQGPVENLLPYLDSGWRIATLTDFNYLMSRDEVPTGTSYPGLDVPGNGSESGEFMRHLGFRVDDDAAESYDQPWLCIDFGGISDCSIDTVSGSPIVLWETYLDGQFIVWTTFLTSVPLYYQICGITEYCIGEGRTMLVRNVPLPTALLMLLSSILTFGLSVRGDKTDVS